MSFAGRGIVITRPRELGEVFARAIEGRGARALVFPTIDIEPLPAPAALARLREYDLVVFVSPSAVRVALAAKPGWPPRVAAAVGAGTRRELERAGATRVIAPAAGADSEALLAASEMPDVRGKRVLIVRGENGRALLGAALGERGAQVEYADCYRRVRPAGDAAPLIKARDRGELHALTVSSSEAFDNLLGMGGAPLVASVPLFVSHERIARHARSRGAREVVTAGATDDEMLERLVAYFDARS
jgi:uroporphyrinogen-III synthase